MVPPIAVSAAEYSVPVCPLGSDVVAIVSVVGADAMVSAKLNAAVWAEGVVESDTLNVSGVFEILTVGVPLICPVRVLSVNPAGSVPESSCHL